MKFWHRWRVRRIERDLRTIDESIERIDEAYINAYYHSTLHNFVVKRIELYAQLLYHKEYLE